MPPERAAHTPERERWLTPGVGGISAASVFSDAGHEISTSILPSFLTSTSHASAGVLGLIEGASDALTGLTKLAAGPLADDPLAGSGFGAPRWDRDGGDPFSSAVAGLLYATVSATAAFSYAAAWMVLSAIAAAALVERRRDVR